MPPVDPADLIVEARCKLGLTPLLQQSHPAGDKLLHLPCYIPADFDAHCIPLEAVRAVESIVTESRIPVYGVLITRTSLLTIESWHAMYLVGFGQLLLVIVNLAVIEFLQKFVKQKLQAA